MRARMAGYSIGEVPITFVDRVYGESKLGNIRPLHSAPFHGIKRLPLYLVSAVDLICSLDNVSYSCFLLRLIVRPQLSQYGSMGPYTPHSGGCVALSLNRRQDGGRAVRQRPFVPFLECLVKLQVANSLFHVTVGSAYGRLFNSYSLPPCPRSC